MDSRNRKKRKKELALEEDSGQTDAQRRKLRHAFRDVEKTIHQKTEEMQDPNSSTFSQIQDKNNALFAQVRYRREAVLDGRNFHLISDRGKHQIDRLVQVPRYDPIRFTQKLRQKCTSRVGSNSFFDWNVLGVATGACFNTLPSRVHFLQGPLHLDYEPKERTARRKRRTQNEEDEASDEEPEQQKKASKTSQMSVVEESMKVLDKMMQRKCRDSVRNRRQVVALVEGAALQEEAKQRIKEDGGIASIPAIPFLFNPQSFTKTVENMFYLSFLVKKGDATIRVCNGKPVVTSLTSLNKKKGDKAMPPPARQAIVPFTMKDFRGLCQAYSLEHDDTPDRVEDTGRRRTKDRKARGRKRALTAPEREVDFREALENDESRSIVDMLADGNCMFRALSDQLYHDRGDRHQEIRSDVCDFMAAKEADFTVFLVLDEADGDEDAANFDAYISKMREDGTWGGDPELNAASQFYRRDIQVFAASASYTIHHGAAKSAGADLRVSYHEHGHYNSVRDMRAPVPSPPRTYPAQPLKVTDIDETSDSYSVQG